MAEQHRPLYSGQTPRTPQEQFHSGGQPALFWIQDEYQPVPVQAQARYPFATYQIQSEYQPAPFQNQNSRTNMNGTNSFATTGNGQLEHFNAMGNVRFEPFARSSHSTNSMQSVVRPTQDQRFHGQPKATERKWLKNMMHNANPVDQQYYNMPDTNLQNVYTAPIQSLQAVRHVQLGHEFRRQQPPPQYFRPQQAVQPTIGQLAMQQLRSSQQSIKQQAIQNIRCGQEIQQRQPIPSQYFGLPQAGFEYLRQPVNEPQSFHGNSMINSIDLTADTPTETTHSVLISSLIQTPVLPHARTSAKPKATSNPKAPTSGKKRKADVSSTEGNTAVDAPKTKKVKNRGDNSPTHITEQIQDHVRGQIGLKEKSWMKTAREELQAAARLTADKIATEAAASRLATIMTPESAKKRRQKKNKETAAAIARVEAEEPSQLPTPPKELFDHLGGRFTPLANEFPDNERLEAGRKAFEEALDSRHASENSGTALAPVGIPAPQTPTPKKRGRPSKKAAATKTPKAPKTPTKRGPRGPYKKKGLVATPTTSDDDAIENLFGADMRVEDATTLIANERGFDELAFAAELEAELLNDSDADMSGDLEADLMAAFEAQEDESNISEQEKKTLLNAAGRHVYDSDGLKFGEEGFFGDDTGAFSDEDD